MKNAITLGTSLLLLSVSLLFATACKSKNAPTPSVNFISGLDQHKTFDQLTDQEKEQFLASTYQYRYQTHYPEPLATAMITYTAIMMAQAQFPETDAQLRKTCIENREVMPLPSPTFRRPDHKVPSPCAATVAEAEQCIETSLAHIYKLTDSLASCENITLARLNDRYLEQTLKLLNENPPGCEPLARKCPGFLTQLPTQKLTFEASQNFSANLDKDKTIDTLTDPEKTQLLERLRRHQTPTMPKTTETLLSCSMQAAGFLMSALDKSQDQIRELCATTRDQCIRNQETKFQEMPPVSLQLIPTTCTATVAETETCIDARYALIETQMNAVTPCETLTIDHLKNPESLFPAASQASATPNGCEPLAKKCPGFLTPHIPQK